MGSGLGVCQDVPGPGGEDTGVCAVRSCGASTSPYAWSIGEPVHSTLSVCHEGIATPSVAV